jgi:hypothetical protein
MERPKIGEMRRNNRYLLRSGAFGGRLRAAFDLLVLFVVPLTVIPFSHDFILLKWDDRMLPEIKTDFRRKPRRSSGMPRAL